MIATKDHCGLIWIELDNHFDFIFKVLLKFIVP